MDKKLIQWNTARYIKDNIDDYTFLNGFKSINEDIYNIWTHLLTYRRANISSDRFGDLRSLTEKFEKHLDNMLEFHRFVDSEHSEQEVAQKSLSLFSNDSVRSVVCIDLLEVERVDILKEYCKDIAYLFSKIDGDLHKEQHGISPLLSWELCEILRTKGLDLFQIPDKLLINNQVNQTTV